MKAKGTIYKLLFLFGRKARRNFSLLLCGWLSIFLIILLILHLGNQQFSLNRGKYILLTKYGIKVPVLYVKGNNDTDNGKDIDNVSEIIMTSNVTDIASRKVTLTKSSDRNYKIFPTMIPQQFPKSAPGRADNDFSITLRPNFSQMINSSQVITTVTAPFLIENKDLCTSVKNLTVLIMVHTAIDHFERRMSTRMTWANNTFYRALGNARTLFLLGQSRDGKYQERVREESEKYGDVLQGEFIDSYHNLTLKGVMAYKWLSERCRNAKFIMKTDDDILVNMFKLFTDILPNYFSKERQIICRHILSYTMPIIRKNDSKWFVHHRHFRGRTHYPTAFCSGFMAIFTNDLMPAFYRSAKVTPFFWVDDVYLYGLVPGNVPGVKYNSIEGNWYQLNGPEALKCYRNVTRSCDYLAIGAKRKGEIDEIWFHIVKRYFYPNATS